MNFDFLTISIADLKFIIEKGLSLDFCKFLRGEEFLGEREKEELKRIIQENKEGKPLEYILKKSVFFGLDFYIDERVFIPRPETEILVESFLEFVEAREGFSVLEIGTGSGNLAISIAMNKPSFKVFSIDLSAKALEVAYKNVSTYKLQNIFLINADLLSSFKRGSFDVIISNPPYVESSYIDKSKSLKFEPRLALDGGEDGLIFIRRILDEAGYYLKKEGLLFLEIGYNQKEKILNYAEEKGWTVVCVRRDYAGIERVVVFKNSLCYNNVSNDIVK